MKTLRRYVSVVICALAATLLAGCSSGSSVSLPAAKGYSVLASGTEFWAKSVRIHGSWAELETDSGPVWVSGAVITPKNLIR
jgi:uncharacterized protein YceK